MKTKKHRKKNNQMRLANIKMIRRYKQEKKQIRTAKIGTQLKFHTENKTKIKQSKKTIGARQIGPQFSHTVMFVYIKRHTRVNSKLLGQRKQRVAIKIPVSCLTFRRLEELKKKKKRKFCAKTAAKNLTFLF